MKKITRNMFLNWHGKINISKNSDTIMLSKLTYDSPFFTTQYDGLIDYFLLILNLEFSDINNLKNEIIEYNKENCNEENY